MRRATSRGIPGGENRVVRRMQVLGLKAVQAKKFKVTTDSEHNQPVATDRLQQNFTAAHPDAKWDSDIRYVWTAAGWLYLAVVIDLYSRTIIGWSLQPRMTQQLVCEALGMALFRRGFLRGVIVHSNRAANTVPGVIRNCYNKINWSAV